MPVVQRLSAEGYETLRIIAGTRKGRKLQPIKGRSIRPTSDRIRESVFNIIGMAVSDASVLDLYAGTGAMGIEALSRGAAFAVFAEKSPYALQTIRRNIAHLDFTDRALIVREDILKGLSLIETLGRRFNIVFMDPPYRKDCVAKTLSFLSGADIFFSDARVIAEHGVAETTPEIAGNLALYDQRKYGKTMVSFYGIRFLPGAMNSKTQGSVKNNLVEFAPEFAVALIDLIEQNRRNSELFRGLLRLKIG
jgi:16S rRNA (guanine(966)-N(2))-methyltransferase RsmD